MHIGVSKFHNMLQKEKCVCLLLNSHIAYQICGTNDLAISPTTLRWGWLTVLEVFRIQSNLLNPFDLWIGGLN